MTCHSTRRRAGCSMPSRCRSVVLLTTALIAMGCAGPPPTRVPPARELRVCSDPNNLPFSNDRLEGFENRIAALAARDLGMRVEYTWWAQRRGFLRNTLNAGICDVVVGLPSGIDGALTTRPYYRSSYVA